jgi:hypothetical protein
MRSVHVIFQGEAIVNSILQSLGRPAGLALTIGLMAFCLWKFGRGPVAEIVANYQETCHWQQVLVESNERALDLAARRDRIQARQKMWQRITGDLIEGQITIHDAAREYARLPDQPPHFAEILQWSEQGATHHERLCRHLIDYASNTLFDDPARQQEVRRRLTAELEGTSR